jgi:hypothetical protein
MKKIIVPIITIVFLFSAEICSSISGHRMGGFKSATSTGGGGVDIKCGAKMDKKCYTQRDNGDVVIGEPVAIFVYDDPTDFTKGSGYVNASFQGYDVSGVPESGIKFDVTPATDEYDNYQDWDNNSSGTN